MTDPLNVACGIAYERCSRYCPCTHFWYSIAFWMSRFFDAASASASSSVNTFGAAGAACEAGAACAAAFAACPIATSSDICGRGAPGAVVCADAVTAAPPASTRTARPIAAALAWCTLFLNIQAVMSSRIV